MINVSCLKISAATLSPASPAIKNPTATSCQVVFHFASRDTGTLTSQLGQVFAQT